MPHDEHDLPVYVGLDGVAPTGTTAPALMTAIGDAVLAFVEVVAALNTAINRLDTSVTRPPNPSLPGGAQHPARTAEGRLRKCHALVLSFAHMLLTLVDESVRLTKTTTALSTSVNANSVVDSAAA